MTMTVERVRSEVKLHAPELISTAAVLAAATVVAHYKNKYGGEVVFTVSPETMEILHKEGTAVLQKLANGNYSLGAIPNI